MKKVLIPVLLACTFAYGAPGDAIVTIDGQKINQDYVNVLLERNYPNVQYSQLDAGQKKVIVDQAIEKKLLAGEARKSGLDKSDKYKKAVEALVDDLLVTQYAAAELKKISVSKDEIKAAYAIIKPMVNPQLHLRQLVLKTEEEATSILGKLQALNHEEILKTFKELAPKSLDTASIKTEGDLGWISVEKIVEPFRAALLNTKPSELVKTPIKGQTGWHVVYFEGVNPQREATMEEANSMIENAVKNEKLQKILQEKLKALKTESKIVRSN